MQNSKLQFKIQNFKELLFLFFPIIKFKIKEKSMEPAIQENSIILVNRYYFYFKKPKIGEVIVLKNPIQEKEINYIIKRIEKIDKNKIFVIGDNKKESVDSRKFGWIDINNIIGKVIGV